MPFKWSCGSTVFALDFHPFKSSDCFRANLFLVWRFFSLSLFLCHHISDVFTYMAKTNNQYWVPTDWAQCAFSICSGNFTHQCFRISVEREQLFCRRPTLNTKLIWHKQSVKQNHLLSGYLCAVSHHLIFCWVILHCLWYSDLDLGCGYTHNHHWLTRQTVSEKKQKWKRL